MDKWITKNLPTDTIHDYNYQPRYDYDDFIELNADQLLDKYQIYLSENDLEDTAFIQVWVLCRRV